MSSTRKRQGQPSAAKRNAAIEKISIVGLTARMGPIGLHTYADAFLAAAKKLPPPSVRFDPVRPFLVCRAIELGLKAFLSLQGSTMLKLAERDGHNLESLLRKADGEGLANSVELSDSLRRAICHASVYYEGKVFEYPAVGEAMSGYPGMPTLELLFEAAAVLVEALRQPCREAD